MDRVTQQVKSSTCTSILISKPHVRRHQFFSPWECLWALRTIAGALMTRGTFASRTRRLLRSALISATPWWRGLGAHRHLTFCPRLNSWQPHLRAILPRCHCQGIRLSCSGRRSPWWPSDMTAWRCCPHPTETSDRSDSLTTTQTSPRDPTGPTPFVLLHAYACTVMHATDGTPSRQVPPRGLGARPRIDPSGSEGACSPRPARIPARQRHGPGRARTGSARRGQKEPALLRKRSGTLAHDHAESSEETAHRLNYSCL